MRRELKKIIIAILFFLISGIVMFSVTTTIQYNNYKKDVNNFVYGILNTIKEKYPNVTEQEIIEILNNDSKSFPENLRKYGINEDSPIIWELEKNYHTSLILNIVLITSLVLVGFCLLLYFYLQKERKIREITNYMKEINNRNYLLNINNNGEGELSILRNEVYKTTIMLQEESDILKKEKLALKDSISDISHQLKTPLTSIIIMLDNILDNPTMPEETKQEFILNVQHQVENINFLIVALLKLSRFEAGVVEFKKENINVDKLFAMVIKNVNVLKQTKNININLTSKDNIHFVGDFNWEVEAFTNILKNAIEYSNPNGQIDVIVEDNKLYTKILIKDYGKGMNKKDLSSIFKRFYKGTNSTSDSVGIGLNLAKSIIEKDNGYISVDSKIDVGTIFTVKYLK